MNGRWRDDEATVTVLVLGLTVALLMVAGLVYDGGRVLAARRLAHDLADNAARAGAQALDLDVLRAHGAVRLDPDQARSDARRYLLETGHDGEVEVTGDGLTVTVHITTQTTLLQLVGIPSRTVVGTGHAQLVRGIDTPEN